MFKPTIKGRNLRLNEYIYNYILYELPIFGQNNNNKIHIICKKSNLINHGTPRQNWKNVHKVKSDIIVDKKENIEYRNIEPHAQARGWGRWKSRAWKPKS